MCKLSIIFIFSAICFQASQCAVYGRAAAGGSQSRSSSYVGKRNSYMLGATENLSTENSNNLGPNNSKKLSNLSAWGLILIIIAIILCGFIFYYGVICYPFLCRNEKNWHTLDVSSTTSGASSRSTEFESHPFRSRSTTPDERH